MNKSYLYIGFISLIFGSIGSIIFSISYEHFYGKTFGVVYMKEIITRHVKSVPTDNMSEVEISERSQLFSNFLDQSIEEISSEYKVLLLVDAAVVTHAPDYTDLVYERIKGKIDERFKGKKK